MTVQIEQERLIAHTLAILQRLANEAVAPLQTVSPPAMQLRHARVERRDLNAEMQARLKTFRNRQRFVEIEREAHYQRAMQRILAVTEQ